MINKGISLTLIFMLFIIQSSYSKENMSAKSQVSEKGKAPILCKRLQNCLLSINGINIKSDLLNTESPVELTHLDFNKDLYLIKIFQGDGCPIKYKILHLLSDENHYLSESFGNCNEYSNISSDADNKNLIVKFPALEVASRQAKSYNYSIKYKIIEQ